MISSFQKNKQKRIKEVRKRFHFEPHTQNNKSNNTVLKQKISEIIIKDENGQFSSVKQNNEFNDSSWLARLVNGIQQSDHPSIKPSSDLDNPKSQGQDKNNNLKLTTQPESFTIIRKSTQPIQRQMSRKSVPSVSSLPKYQVGRKLSKDSQKQNSRMSCVTKIQNETPIEQKNQKVVKQKYEKWTVQTSQNVNCSSLGPQNKKIPKSVKNSQKTLLSNSNSNSNTNSNTNSNSNLFKYQKNKKKQHSNHMHKNSLINYSSIMQEDKNFDTHKDQELELESPQKIIIDLDEISLKTQMSREGTPVNLKRKISTKQKQGRIQPKQNYNQSEQNRKNTQQSNGYKRGQMYKERQENKQRNQINKKIDRNLKQNKQILIQVQDQVINQIQKQGQKSKQKQNKKFKIKNELQNSSNMTKKSKKHLQQVENKSPLNYKGTNELSKQKQAKQKINKLQSANVQKDKEKGKKIQREQQRQNKEQNRQGQFLLMKQYVQATSTGTVPQHNTPELRVQLQQKNQNQAQVGDTQKYRQLITGQNNQKCRDKDNYNSSYNQFLDTFKQQSIPQTSILHQFKTNQHPNLNYYSNQLYIPNFNHQLYNERDSAYPNHNQVKPQSEVPRIGKIKRNTTNYTTKQPLIVQSNMITKLEVRDLALLHQKSEHRIPTFSERPVDQCFEDGKYKQYITQKYSENGCNNRKFSINSYQSYNNNNASPDIIRNSQTYSPIKVSKNIRKQVIDEKSTSVSTIKKGQSSYPQSQGHSFIFDIHNNRNNVSMKSSINQYHPNAQVYNRKIRHIQGSNYYANQTNLHHHTTLIQSKSSSKPLPYSNSHTHQLTMESPKFNCYSSVHPNNKGNPTDAHMKYQQIFRRLDAGKNGTVTKNNCNQNSLNQEERYQIGSILSKIKYLDRVFDVKEFVSECLRIAGTSYPNQHTQTHTLSNSHNKSTTNYHTFQPISTNIPQPQGQKSGLKQAQRQNRKQNTPVSAKNSKINNPNAQNLNNSNVGIKNTNTNTKQKKKQQKYYMRTNQNVFRGNILNNSTNNLHNSSNDKLGAKPKRIRKYSQKSDNNIVNNTYTDRVLNLQEHALGNNINHQNLSYNIHSNKVSSAYKDSNHLSIYPRSSYGKNMGPNTNSNAMKNKSMEGHSTNKKNINQSIYRPLFPETNYVQVEADTYPSKSDAYQNAQNPNRQPYIQMSSSFPNQTNAEIPKTIIIDSLNENTHWNPAPPAKSSGSQDRHTNKGDIGTIIDSLNSKLSHYIQTNNLEDTYRKFKLQFVQLRRNMQY